MVKFKLGDRVYTERFPNKVCIIVSIFDSGDLVTIAIPSNSMGWKFINIISRIGRDRCAQLTADGYRGWNIPISALTLISPIWLEQKGK